MPYKVPASRSDICNFFVQKCPEKVNPREALLKILADVRPAGQSAQRASPYKQTLPKEWGLTDVPVFKAGINENGLIVRPGWQLMPMKTVTMRLMVAALPGGRPLALSMEGVHVQHNPGLTRAVHTLASHPCPL